MSIVAQIAPACAAVAGRADHVSIHEEKIADYAAFILGKYPLVTRMEGGHHFISGDVEETAAYILALDSINFGSGYFHIARECGLGLEYDVIAGGLKGAFERKELNRPAQWCEITAKDFSRLLKMPQGAHPELDSLRALFAEHLREAGKKLLEEYGGKVQLLIGASGRSAPALADIVASWEGFRDIHSYKGLEVPVLKRAQILASDLNLAAGMLEDMDALTIFADNMVPHVLRCDGILEYGESLSAKIENGIPLLPGSAEEVEIRACAIHAVELMKKAAGGGITSVNLDHLLWHRGYEPGIYSRKTHRTLTTDY